MTEQLPKSLPVTLEDIPWKGGVDPSEYGRVFQVFLTGPELADTWLAIMIDRNRPQKPRLIEQIVHDILHDNWVLTHQPILIIRVTKTKWLLIDGQNRLHAIRESGMTVPLNVCFGGVFDEVFRTIDTGNKRGLADALRTMDVDEPINLAATIVHVWRHANNAFWTYRTPSTSEGLQTYAQHPNLEHSLVVGKRLQGLLPPSMASAMHYIMSNVNSEDTDWFFDHLENGTDPRSPKDISAGVSEEEHPIHLLREWLLKVRATTTMWNRSDIRERTAYTLKAWNLYRHGETRKRLYFKMGGTNAEPWPGFDEEASE